MTPKNPRKSPRRKPSDTLHRSLLLFRCQATVAQGMPCVNTATALHPFTGQPVCFDHWSIYTQQFG